MFFQAYKVLLFIIAVQFLRNASSAVESDGSISFTIISSVESDSPFTVQVCTREIVPQSAEGLLKLYKTIYFIANAITSIMHIVFTVFTIEYTNILLAFISISLQLMSTMSLWFRT